MRGSRAKQLRRIVFGDKFPRPALYRLASNGKTIERGDKMTAYRAMKKGLAR